MKRVIYVFAVITTIALLVACTSTNTAKEENLTQGEFFQKAQAASMEFNDYQQALLYYKTFIEKYPDEQILIIEAEYEIAFLYYKMEDYKTASELFTKITDKYKQPEAALLPAWPEVLSKRILEIIETSADEEAENSIEPITAAE
jgi:outer membrane protein assembly factor BamD (BamD/ComL family)